MIGSKADTGLLHRRPLAKLIINLIVGSVFASLLLIFIFRGTDWNALYHALRRVHVEWLLLSQIPLWASLYTRTYRWQFVTKQTASVPFRFLFSATQIGFLINILIPARIGEVVRAYVLSRLAKLEFSKSIALVALDRTTDLIGLVLMVLVAVAVFPTDRPITIPSEIFQSPEAITIPPGMVSLVAFSLTVGLLFLLAVFFSLYRFQDIVMKRADAVFERILPAFSERILLEMSKFANGLHLLRSSGDMIWAAGLSIMTWVLSISCIGCVIQAFGISCPWYTPLIIEVFAIIFTVVPLAPAMIGQFHLAVAAGLIISAPATDPSAVKALTLLTHSLAMLPFVLAGAFCLVRERLGLFSVVRAGLVK